MMQAKWHGQLERDAVCSSVFGSTVTLAKHLMQASQPGLLCASPDTLRCLLSSCSSSCNPAHISSSQQWHLLARPATRSSGVKLGLTGMFCLHRRLPDRRGWRHGATLILPNSTRVQTHLYGIRMPTTELRLIQAGLNEGAAPVLA